MYTIGILSRCNTVGNLMQIHIRYTLHNNGTQKSSHFAIKIMSAKKSGRWSTSGPEGIQ